MFVAAVVLVETVHQYTHMSACTRSYDLDRKTELQMKYSCIPLVTYKCLHMLRPKPNAHRTGSDTEVKGHTSPYAYTHRYATQPVNIFL